MITQGNSSEVAIGIFDSRDKAETAVTALYAAGFNSTAIGVVAKQGSDWSNYSAASEAATPAEETEENVATGAATGAVAGAGIGGLWALGIAAGMLPAIGPIVAGGILGSVLASAAAGAAAGGVVGALVGLGVPEEEARYYDKEVSSGRTLITVNAGPRYSEAVSILRDHGARDVTSRESAASSPAGVRTGL